MCSGTYISTQQITERGDPAKKEKLRVQRIDQMEHFFTFQYQITEKCNLRCTHCYEDGSITYEPTTEELLLMLNKFLDAVKKWKYNPVIPLSGGEPLLSKSFWPLLDYLEEYGEKKEISVTVLSNGTLIDRSVAERLSKYTVLHFVQISLDGTVPETHEAVRGKGTFRKSVKAVSHLVDADLDVYLHFVVHKQNYEEAFKITELAKTLNVSGVLVTRLVPFGRGREMKDFMLTPEEVKRLYTKLGKDADEAEKKIRAGEEAVLINRFRCDWPVVCTKNCLSSMHALVTQNGGNCQVGKSYIAVMPDGTCYACRRMPIVVGNLLHQSFDHVWNHPFLWKMRRKFKYMKGKCRECPFNTNKRVNFTCMGGATCVAYGFYDDPFMPDPQCSFDPETEGEDIHQRIDRLYKEYRARTTPEGENIHGNP
ncbi:MAG: radical SAM protein [Theionarchaea archaeon]|nr:radical SAM protein [Theionarchaea archaeon]